MVLHVYVFDKTLKILMMASMMANSDALYAIETRKPAQQLSSRKVQHCVFIFLIQFSDLI